jgi:hypothetical protein
LINATSVIYISVCEWGATCFVLCFAVKSHFYLCVAKEFGGFPYFFSAVCECEQFCFVALGISVSVLFSWDWGFCC